MESSKRRAPKDRRTRRTRERLRGALSQLLMEKPLNQISVKELSEMADINRGTFYLHFQDVYHLYDQMEDEVLAQFNAMVVKHNVEDHVQLLPVLDEAFHFLYEMRDECVAIIHTNGHDFLSRLVEQCRPKSPKEWAVLLRDREAASNGFRDYLYEFITMGCIGILRRWLSSGMSESPEEMSRVVEELMTRCIVGARR